MLSTWLAATEGTEASCCSSSSLFLFFLPLPLRLPFPFPFLPFLRGVAVGSGPLCKGQHRHQQGEKHGGQGPWQLPPRCHQAWQRPCRLPGRVGAPKGPPQPFPFPAWVLTSSGKGASRG